MTGGTLVPRLTPTSWLPSCQAVRHCSLSEGKIRWPAQGNWELSPSQPSGQVVQQELVTHVFEVLDMPSAQEHPLK
jgi:hypothetical protein